MIVRLEAHDGYLYIPESAIADRLLREYYEGDGLVALLCVYDAGDCDSIRWPRPNLKNLRRALYDAREEGLIAADATVLLPDGEQAE